MKKTITRVRSGVRRGIDRLVATSDLATAARKRLHAYRRSNSLRSNLKVGRRYRRAMHLLDAGLELEYDPAKARINEIEINKNCNLNCIMCNTALSTRPDFNMDLSLFENVVRKARELQPNHSLALHTIGEPLVNPQLPEYLEILRRSGMRIKLSTNALQLGDKMPLLFEFADVIDTLRFSIDGASRETYEAIRRPGKFSRLIENMDAFAAEQNKRPGIKRLKLKMDSIVSTDVQHELAYHLEFYSKYVPMENIGLHLVNGLSPDNTYFFEKSILKNFIIPTNPCSQLAGPMNILNDGRVSVCCRDYQGDLVIGNIRESSARDLWNGDSVRELRRQHIENDIPSDSLCADCFVVDGRVAVLFELFTAALVQRNRAMWVVPAMQRRFDAFFSMFEADIPNERSFLSLLA